MATSCFFDLSSERGRVTEAYRLVLERICEADQYVYNLLKWKRSEELLQGPGTRQDESH